MRLRRFLTLLAAGTIVLAACGGDDATEPDSGAAVDPSGSWVMVSGPTDPIPGWDVTVTIEGDRIDGTAACNGYGGAVDWDDDGTMTVDELSWTEMGCEPAVQALEQEFLAALTAVTSFERAGDELALVTPSGTWSFERLAAVPTSELVGTTWVLDGYTEGDWVMNDPGMERAYLELADDGTLTGTTNCRQLTGEWSVSGADVQFTTFAADGDCPDSAAWELDGRIVTVLGDGFRVEIDGDRMTATSQGDEGLVFRAGERPRS